MFVRWSRSYLIIAVVAILMLGVFGARYTGAIRQELENTNHTQLQLTRILMDQNLNILRKISAKENFNDIVKTVKQASSYDALPRYDLYRLTRAVEQDMINYGLTQEYFIYFPVVDLALDANFYGRSTDYIARKELDAELPPEEWEKLLKGEYRSTQIMVPLPDGQEHATRVILVRPLDINNREKPRALAVMVLGLDNLIAVSDWLETDRLCILDRNVKSLNSTSVIPEEIQEKLFRDLMANRDSVRSGKMKYGTILASFISLEYENWDIVVLSEEAAYLNSIHELWKFAAMMLIVYLVISVLIVGRAFLVDYKRLKTVVTILDPQKKDPADAYDYIGSSVKRLVEENRQNVNLIAKQQEAITRAVFSQLLTGPGRKAGREALSQHGLVILAEGSYVLLAYRIIPGSVPEDTDAKMLDTFMFILRNITEENLQNAGLRFNCFRNGRNEQLFLVGGDAAALVENTWKACSQCRAFLKTHFHFGYCAAISLPHTGEEELSAAYTEIGMVFNAQEDNESLTCYRDIDLLPSDSLLTFSVDAENRLTVAVRSGDREKAAEEIQNLIEKNRRNCLTPGAFQFLINKIMASLLPEAESITDEEVIAKQNRVLVSVRNGDQKEMTDALLALSDLITDKRGNLNQRQESEERGRFYQEILNYVEIHLEEPTLNVNAVAAAFDRQAPYISRYFKEMNGENLNQYIQKQRLQRAKILLFKGEKLESIAEQCGFGSQRTFLRVFKQYEGVTPTQFRQLQGEK